MLWRDVEMALGKYVKGSNVRETASSQQWLTSSLCEVLHIIDTQGTSCVRLAGVHCCFTSIAL